MKLTKVITTGVIATAIMSVVAIMAPMMGMPKMDFGEMLGANNPMIVMPYAAGWMMHFVIGIVLTAIYASVFLNRLSGAYVIRGIIFAMLPFVMAQSMMMPMMGNGFWSGGDIMAIMGSFIGHVCFGAVLGSVYAEGE
ncbi:MAG: hypothetical protein HOL62_03315 [Candidatus Marinimicrobia bacterium]|jgi:hypothetical protein|nr:hypothetical protein [Candidatus Neomarinimicrobiota bacterium]MBT3944759.1 hypothetical protein [Candidatus Neomarinimicrobiota bacterium]MBT4925911.1 hypothetical protein [Candidatus Neomarinimicrobiota bacterium]MBT5251715.1 hypothetical protein [Candidatus Neomarinimicrobiota bacterium]MBT5490129.1 hypothetical protein [Candidatus Neomarinimicrobiota bacterium]